jgi:hypothetical protein
VGFDHAHHHIDAGPQPCRAFGQHLIGLADPGCGAQEKLQAAAPFARSGAQQGIRIGARGLVGANQSFLPAA